MRKLIALTMLCVLACGLAACGAGETYAPKYDGSTVPVAKSDVENSRRVTHERMLDYLDSLRGHEFQPLEDSYIVQKQQSYRGHWYDAVYYAYPKFGDEIAGAGAKKIRQYYKQQYNKCSAAEDFPWLAQRSAVTDAAEGYIQYDLQVYAVEQADGYVSVVFTTETLTEDRGTTMRKTADVFELATGETITLADAVDLQACAAAINRAVADRLRLADIPALAPYDVLGAQDPAFSIGQDNVTLFFAPGELAHEDFGSIAVQVARSALGM